MSILDFISPIGGLVSAIGTGINNKLKHAQDMALISRAQEKAVAEKKLDLAKAALDGQSGQDLIALQTLKNLEQGLGDTWMRRILITIMATPFGLLTLDIMGLPQWGSAKVKEYFDLVNLYIPQDYQLFVVAMIGGYFAINKVVNIFKR